MIPILLLWILAIPGVPQTLPRDLQVRVEQTLSVPAVKNATIGFLVRSLDKDETLYERNADLALLPASNQKILTSTLILHKLGAGFRYKTSVLRVGDVRDGVLNGDLYLRGSGDPSLTSERLLQMAMAVKAAGIRKITGRIYGDGSAFDDAVLGSGWQWDDEPFYYSAQVGGLNCDENVVALEVNPDATAGGAARVRVGGANALRWGFLGTTYIRVRNNAVTTAPGTEANIAFDRTRGTNEFRITGTLPQGGRAVLDELTVEDPNRFAATRFAELLSLAGVECATPAPDRAAVGKTPSDAVMVTESTSATLGELVKQFLKTSDNLYGECFLKTVGGGKTAEGASVLRTFLAEMGVPSDGLNAADGSGLSRNDTVTPRILAGLLAAVETKFATENYAAFAVALPVAGVDGTLRNRFKGTPGAGNIRAKTGNLSGVTALSGYLTTKSGERLVFSLLINNYVPSRGAEARKAMDDAILIFTDTPRNR